ncbi:MAG: DNA-3-methyladenine glycosylase [Acetatifactor sp.]
MNHRQTCASGVWKSCRGQKEGCRENQDKGTMSGRRDTLWTEGTSPITREFFLRDGITVAKELLGKILVHETPIGTVRGIITEVESYMGEEDKGSHTYGGRRTERTEPMYHVGGTSYVYLIYGMYSCMNIAVMPEGIAQAVLLRSVVPADRESEQRMQQLRMLDLTERKERRARRASGAESSDSPVKDTPGIAGEQINMQLPVSSSVRKHLADGPGKLCIAMGITRADNDVDMVGSGSFYVTEGITVLPSEIRAGKRIGIDYAEEAADFLWRFYLEDVDL